VGLKEAAVVVVTEGVALEAELWSMVKLIEEYLR
jgi:hypothetical protein